MVPLLILVIVVIWEFWEHVFILSPSSLFITQNLNQEWKSMLRSNSKSNRNWDKEIETSEKLVGEKLRNGNNW